MRVFFYIKNNFIFKRTNRISYTFKEIYWEKTTQKRSDDKQHIHILKICERAVADVWE